MKRKKQPSAEVYREQLRLAADQIIRLNEQLQFNAVRIMAQDISRLPFRMHSQPWWRRMFRKSA